MMNRIRSAMACVCLIPAVVLLPGCLVAGSQSTQISGQRVEQSSIALVEPGETTEEQIIQLVGVPTRAVELGDNRKVFVYEWTQREASSTRILVLFRGHNSTESRGITNIELVDGIVSRLWNDEA